MNNIKESTIMNELLIAINQLNKQFIAQYLASPLQRTFIHGINVPSKRDVQREFVMNLKCLISTMTLTIPGVDAKKSDGFQGVLDALDKMDVGSGNEIQDEVDDE